MAAEEHLPQVMTTLVPEAHCRLRRLQPEDLDLLDKWAGQAMQALLQGSPLAQDEDVAKGAYEVAAAMLAHRNVLLGRR